MRIARVPTLAGADLIRVAPCPGVSYRCTVPRQKLARKWRRGTGLGKALAKTDIVRILAERFGLGNYLGPAARRHGSTMAGAAD